MERSDVARPVEGLGELPGVGESTDEVHEDAKGDGDDLWGSGKERTKSDSDVHAASPRWQGFTDAIIRTNTCRDGCVVAVDIASTW